MAEAVKLSVRGAGQQAAPPSPSLARPAQARPVPGPRLVVLPGGLAFPGAPPRHSRPGEEEVLARAALRHGAARVDPRHPLPDPLLVHRIGAAECLRLGLVPLRQAGAATVVATSRPGEFAARRAGLEARLGPVIMTLAPAARVAEAIRGAAGAHIARRAESRTAAAESCRGWGGPTARRWARGAALALVAALVAAPLVLAQAVLCLALAVLLAATVLKLAAALSMRGPAAAAPAAPAAMRGAAGAGEGQAMAGEELPVVSLIVALYREDDIARRLVARLSLLDYPRHCLDVILAVEADDRRTRDALAAAALPPWMRVVVVPHGRVRTKPRALNAALDQCRGSIVGVYDAEDAPEPGQIRKVAARFRRAGPEVACLQGVLDYYNPRVNWLSRCFTIEYATWFRLILPGVARLGLAVPLGGTTLFFRRDLLEGLGAWDAHNVTEDADLGIRLFRHGLRTELLDTVTMEEANCRPLPWVKQRSRWIKGFMMTWFVHMRRPRLLWRQVGPRAFLGFQVMMAGPALQALLAPLFWSFWVLAAGLPHPLAATLPAPVPAAACALFVLAALVDGATALAGLRRSGQRLSPLWVATLPFYYPLATLAAYKALWELIRRPFYWDKTAHGLFDGAAQA